MNASGIYDLVKYDLVGLKKYIETLFFLEVKLIFLYSEDELDFFLVTRWLI